VHTQAVEIETVRGTALLCHGLRESDMAQVTPDDYGYAIESNQELQDLRREGGCRYLIAGHTHQPMVRSFGALTIVNPGTLLRDFEPGFAIVDFEERGVQFYGTCDGEAVEGAKYRLA